METKFNFKSAICTDRVQSERLLALGLKKETADCYWWQENDQYGDGNGKWHLEVLDTKEAREHFEYLDKIFDDDLFIPAWSLERLLEMLPNEVKSKEDIQSYTGNLYLDISSVGVAYAYFDYDGDDRRFVGWCGNGLFTAIVDAIEWLIKEGYFNKEYLENGNC